MSSLIAAPVPLRRRTTASRALSVPAVLASRWPWLFLVALGQVLLARLVTKNGTAFQDEGLYIYIGHRIISATFLDGPRLIESPGAYFSGAPGFYPVLAALADSVGGLQAARDLSLVMLIITMVAVQGLAEVLFGRLAGILGAASFALCGSVIYLTQWATFDSMAMMFAALAAWLAVASAKRDGLLYAPLVGLLLFASIMAKYAGAMYLPILAALVVAVGWQRWRWTIVGRAAFMVGTAVVLFFFVVLLFGRGLLPGLAQTTTERTILNAAAGSELGVQTLLWIGPWLALALVAAAIRLRRQPLLVMVLLAASVLGPLQQIRIGEATSLRKHVAFGLIFACALVGDLLAKLVRTKFLVPLAVVLVAALGVHGYHFGGQFLRAYPEDTRLQAILRTTFAANPGMPILAEQSSSQRYELMDITEPKQWNDTYVFTYDGLTSTAAYQKAIEDHYFGVIYLNFTTPQSHAIVKMLSQGDPEDRYYHLVAQVPGTIRDKEVGSWLVWTPQEQRFTPIR